MKKIRLLIVDDEPLAHQVLKSYCDKIDHVEVAGHCYDGLSTINFLNSNAVDALLLDIQMPDLSGIELLESLGASAVKVIFTTAYTEYALQSFDFDQVVDYLHKPIKLSRFLKAIERLKKQLALEAAFKGEAADSPPVATTASDFISLRDNKTVFRVPLEQIDYIQSWGNYLKVFLEGSEVKVVRGTLKEILDELPGSRFEQIHKSYAVQSAKVRAIQGNRVLLDGIELPLGKSYAISARRNILGS